MYRGPYWALVYEKSGLSITPDFRALLLAIFVFLIFRSARPTRSVRPRKIFFCKVGRWIARLKTCSYVFLSLSKSKYSLRYSCLKFVKKIAHVHFLAFSGVKIIKNYFCRKKKFFFEIFFLSNCNYEW